MLTGLTKADWSIQQLPMRSFLFVGVVAAVFVSGCHTTKDQPTTRPVGVRDSQDKAMQDPFGYSPTFDRDISGGKTNEFDKEGMKRDVDHVLNP